MKTRSLIAIALAGTFAMTTGAFAGGRHHSSAPVPAPSSVSETGPATAEPMSIGGTSGASPQGTAGYSSARSGETIDYWHIGEQPSDTGSTSGGAASGSAGFDASPASWPD